MLQYMVDVRIQELRGSCCVFCNVLALPGALGLDQLVMLLGAGNQLLKLPAQTGS